MEIKNCKKCGRIYNYVVGHNLCPRCAKELEDKFQEVKQYIYDHPGVGVAEVSEEMDVTVAQIRAWVKEERLQFAEGSVSDIICESCGKIITCGRFCAKCKEEMIRNLGSAYQKETKHTNDVQTKGAKMRYL